MKRTLWGVLGFCAVLSGEGTLFAEEGVPDPPPVSEVSGELDPPLPPLENPSSEQRPGHDSDPDPDHLAFHALHPRWAFELLGSFRAFGSQGRLGDPASTQVAPQGANSIRALQMALEYQPDLLSRIGVVGFGPYFTFYPLSERQVVSRSLSLWSWGAQFRYQARYFEEQWFVPVVGYFLQSTHYSLVTGSKGSLSSSGPIFGLWILLNFLEPKSAADFYADHGVLRSYLVAEIRRPSGSNSDLLLSGGSFFFGLRFEF